MSHPVDFRAERTAAVAVHDRPHVDAAPEPEVLHLYYSTRALKGWAMAIAIASTPSLFIVFSESDAVRFIGASWLALLAFAANGLANKAGCALPVVTLDRLGITDRRISSRRVYWDEIRSFEPFDAQRALAVEYHLKHPGRSNASETGRSFRLGAWLQGHFGVPAVTINLWLIDTSAAEIAEAVRELRPSLLAPVD